MIKTFKFKLKTTKKQQLVFDQWLNTCRFIYNFSLCYKKELYSYHQISISKYDIQKELTELRSIYPWIGDIHSQTIQDVTDRLFKTYQSFFKGGGFPKFQKKGVYSSFSFKQGVKICPNTSTVKLPSIGKIKYFKSKEIIGEIKYSTIKKQIDGWYICLSCESEALPINEITNQSIGVDMGLKDYVITSNGTKYDNQNFLRKDEEKLKIVQRSISRKKKGGENRKKEINKLKILYLTISNKRKDYLHKLSTRLVCENQGIVMEDLQIRNMSKNHKLAKSIQDASWGIFKQMCEYKSAWQGKAFVLVPPNNTSKACHVCGWIKQDLTLEDREWICEGCGVVHDRDVNAAMNVLKKGKKKSEPGHDFVICGGKAVEEQIFDMAQR